MLLHAQKLANPWQVALSATYVYSDKADGVYFPDLLYCIPFRLSVCVQAFVLPFPSACFRFPSVASCAHLFRILVFPAAFA
jgi:hypothetical protein